MQLQRHEEADAQRRQRACADQHHQPEQRQQLAERLQRDAEVADEAYQAGLAALELGDAEAALRMFRRGP